jgi:hypothetical protein
MPYKCIEQIEAIGGGIRQLQGLIATENLLNFGN